MKLEINADRTITLFLNDDELLSRGFEIDNIEKNITLINALVDEALLFAESTHDFDTAHMPFKTEVAYVPTDGAYISISFIGDATQTTQQPVQPRSTNEDIATYQFGDFEDLIACSHAMPDSLRDYGQLYVYEGKYLLCVEKTAFAQQEDYERVKAFLGEYGKPVNVSLPLIKEYGKALFREQAFREVAVRFAR